MVIVGEGEKEEVMYEVKPDGYVRTFIKTLYCRCGTKNQT